MRIIDLPIEELELSLELQSDGYSIAGIVKTLSDIHVVVAERKLGTISTGVKSFFVSSDGWSGGKAGHQVIRPKKRKKVFIKTLKELVDSGWEWDTDGMFRHPASIFVMTKEMSVFLGNVRVYDRQALQNVYAWSPEMLIEKEV